MASNKNTVYTAKSMSDVVFHIKTVPHLKVLAGCTTVSEWPASSLLIRTIDDFKIINMHEHFVDFGAAVTLSQILLLGKKRLPSVFYEAVETVANPYVRNLATIGGNIASEGMKHTLFAPLLALDAHVEIHSENDAQFIPFSKFALVPEGCFISRVRIPVSDWEVEVFKRLGPSHRLTEESASFTFLANTQKGILSDLRIAFCGVISLRSRELENTIIGSRLPISDKTIDMMSERAAELYDEAMKDKAAVTPMLKDQFLNLLRQSLNQLT